MGVRNWPTSPTVVKPTPTSVARGSVSVLALAVLALGFALLLSGSPRPVSACSAACTSTDSDDSCLFCSESCGLCESAGYTTNCNQPGTAHLTIDDGPFDTTTVALDILKWKNVSASFFLLGVQIAGREAIVQRMLREGHHIGAHSWDHSGFNQLATNIPNQMSQTKAEILRASGQTVTDFRPPYGECNKQCMTALDGWNVRLWNLDTLDYTDSMTTLKSQVDGTMAGYDMGISGWVIGMHLRSNLGLCALPALIDRVRSRGYTFVSADQCWGTASQSPIPGVSIPARVGIPPECNPPSAPLPLNFGACSSSVGCWTPKGCCSTFGYCSNVTSDCGLGCRGGWCDSCQAWIVNAPSPNPYPNTAWPACTTTSPLFINACTSTPNGGCTVANTKECVMTGSGTRTCSCNPGWTGTTCQTNINECATTNGGCATVANCTDLVPANATAPGRQCVCRAGYTGDGLTCTDVNECATSNGGCPVQAPCNNAVPVSPSWTRFTCGACMAGYTGSGQVGTTCTPINECATNNGGCSIQPPVTCTDLNPTAAAPAGYQCGACPTGYATAVNNTCKDIDECSQTPNGGCSTAPPVGCYNTVGSYFCAAGTNCSVGFSNPLRVRRAQLATAATAKCVPISMNVQTVKMVDAITRRIAPTHRAVARAVRVEPASMETVSLAIQSMNVLQTTAAVSVPLRFAQTKRPMQRMDGQRLAVPLVHWGTPALQARAQTSTNALRRAVMQCAHAIR